MTIVANGVAASNRPPVQITLESSLSGYWLKLPEKAMREVGPAALTLAGFLRVTNKQTFTRAENIALACWVPLATVRKHLVTLHERGWLRNCGREKAKTGHARRTCTYRLTERAKSSLEPFGILPWWANCHLGNSARLTWADRAVLSLMLAKLAGMTKLSEREESADMTFEDAYLQRGAEDRFRFPLDALALRTGLSRPSIIAAKRHLKRLGIADWMRSETADILAPNLDFVILKTELPNNLCRLEIQRPQKG